jgi:hypothetical protein
MESWIPVLLIALFHRSKITSVLETKSTFGSYVHFKIQNEKFTKENKSLCNLGMLPKFEIKSVYINIHISCTSSRPEGRTLWLKERETEVQQDMNMNPSLAMYH